jgi:hypothetical protein
VKIGPILYRVVVGPERRSEQGNSLWGEICHATGEIFLWEGLSPEQRYATLWHELIHGLGSQTGMELSEGDIDRIAYGVMQLLMDNALVPTSDGNR